MLFISSKKLFSFSTYSNFCNFFLSFPQFPDSNREMKVELIKMPWIGLRNFADVIFWNKQKPLYIQHQTWSGNTSLIKVFFWTCFVTWRVTGSRPFLFFIVFSIKRDWTPFLRLIILFQNIIFVKEFLACSECFGLFTKIKKGCGTSFWYIFSAWFFHENVPV